MPHAVTRLLHHLGAALPALLLGFAAHAASPAPAAVPAPGTAITNTSTANFLGNASSPSLRVSSNTVTALVQPWEALQLSTPQAVDQAAGTAFAVPQVLTNTGNVATSYTLSVATVGGNFVPSGVEIVEDLNGNGSADAGEPVLTSGAVITLAPHAAMTLLVAAGVPASATAGQSVQLRLTAATQNQTSNASSLDTVIVVGAPVVNVVKSASTAAAVPNGVFTYSLTASNTGSAAAGPASVTINGAAASAFILRDALPANTTFASLASPTAGARLLYHRAGDAAGSYQETPPAAAGIDSIAVAVPDLAVNATLAATLGVMVHGNASGTLNNVAYADFAAQGIDHTAASNDVQLPLPALAPSVAFYSDATYSTPVHQAASGAALYVQINAAQCNTEPTVVLTLPLTLMSSRTGDSETFMATETAANSGFFRIAPDVPTANAAAHAAAPGDGTLEVLPNDQVTATLSGCGTGKAVATLLVDPSGVVFDGRTNTPVGGASIALIDVTGAANGGHPGGPAAVLGNDGITAAASSVVSGADGSYAFPDLAPGTYRLLVTPPAGYAFPSKLTPGQLPPGHDINTAGSYGAPFVLSAAGPVIFDIPLDAAAGGLFLQKTASKSIAQLGDFVDYSITINDNAAVAFTAAVLNDVLPPGFAYVKGSARLNGGPLADPVGGAGPQLRFGIGALAPGLPAALAYRVHLGPGAESGSGVNTAQLVSGSTSSNIATARVVITGGTLSDSAYLFGKVYADCNHDRRQDEHELGIPGVRIFLDDGTYAVTDVEGKYSLYGLTPRTHVAKVDATTLPKGTHLEILDNRNAADAGSQFADLRNGELHKADFAIAECTPAVQAQLAARRSARKGQPAEITRVAAEKIQLESAPIIDPRSLPASGLIGVPASPAAGGGSTLLNAAALPAGLSATGIARADTAHAEPSVAAADAAAAGHGAPGSAAPDSSTPSAAAPPADGAAAGPDAPAAEPPPSLAQVLRTATPDAGFIDLVDGQILAAAQIRVRVKGPLDAQLRLAVNGHDVALAQVGEQSRLESRGISAWEYVGVDLRAGENTLALDTVDAFGNVRPAATLHVIAPGALAQIRIAAAATASADSQTPLAVTITLLDAHGIQVTARTPLTLDSTLGEWQTPDLDPKEPGTQVFLEGGSGRFMLLPPTNPGKGRLRAFSGTASATADVTFLPNLRPLIAAGIVEGTVGVRNGGPGALLAGAGTEAFERDIQSTSLSFADGDAAAAASMFVKGAIPGSNLLTLSYDSDKPDTTLLRDIQPDRFYPVYGDSSIKGFDAQSTGKLYTRVDHGTSYVLYGDYSTQSDNSARVLTQYNRVLNGAKTHVEEGGYTVDAFVSDSDTTQVIDEIPANGTSGPYRLSRLNVSINSERVDIITRDRDQPSIVLADQTLTQFTDYAVEPELGEILFKAPVPSLDAGLNPIYIRVTYEVSNGGPAYWVGGIDVRDKVARTLTLGGTYIRDTNAANRQTLDGLNLLWQPSPATTVAAELGQSQSDLDGTGEARRVELRHNDPGLQAKVYAVETDATFENPNSTYNAGAAEYGAKIGYAMTPSNRLVVDALRTTTAGTLIQAPSSIPLVGLPPVIAGGASQNGEKVALEHKLTKTVKLTAAVRHVDANAIATQPLALGAVPNEFTSASLRVDAPVPDVPKAAAFAQYEEALDSTGREAATVGGTYQLGPQAKLYATHETSDSLSGSYGLSTTQQNYATVVGIDTPYMHDGQFFNEYRVSDGIDGRSDEAALGLRNLWHLAPGLSASTSLQQIHPISGVITNEATALAGALEYTASPDWKGSTRLEWSQSSTAQTWLSSIAVAAKLDADDTVLARGIYNEEINSGPADSGIRLGKIQAGLATRPVDSDVWNALGLLEYKRSANSTLGAGLDTDERAYILSGHLNVQPTADWIVNARYGVKWAADFTNGLSTSGVTQLLGARSVWDIDAHWDLGVQCYTELAPEAGGGRKLAVGAEAGYLVVKNVWLSVGYNIEGFRDPDLAGDDYTQRSFYLRLRFKFDENLFKPRNNAEALPAGVPIPP